LQVVDGVEYIHNRGFAHGDLTPSNILLDVNAAVKVSDFGTMKSLEELHGPSALNDYYTAPEARRGEPYRGDLADIFSLGKILFLLRMCNEFPDDQYEKLLQNFPDFKAKYGSYFNSKKVSDSFFSIFRGMIQFEPEERLTL